MMTKILTKMEQFVTAHSGKSSSRALAGILVTNVCLALDITVWRGGCINGAWASIIASCCLLLGTPWAISHLRSPQPTLPKDEDK